ncbi:hypothetical protein [Pseudoxanthomonas sp. Root630]|uniref:DUF6941 family protein n=1 Tax=Pseudoxanthomonas sp. Root630 TaxID=1736574 RepID=UPI0007031409|nr:hypothetical protein [Pseudoxanthomonas sp. Root630]KRA51820.1 hypothetical protein ASD72_01660 [Pseudoxanthomonas sp. Root630]
MRIQRSIGGIFCDDIREEVNGKISLVGCYTGGMQVESFPATLPKLCVFVRVIFSAHEPPSSVSFRLLRDDEQLVVGHLPPETMPAAAPEGADESLMSVIHGQIVLSPFELTGPCTLRMRAVVDDVELRGLSLKITQRDQVATSTPPIAIV